MAETLRGTRGEALKLLAWGHLPAALVPLSAHAGREGSH
jgi:hypothetical protein